MPDSTDDPRAIHSRITDNDDTIEVHSADIAALSATVQSLAKRLSAVEELLALHCGIDESHVADVGSVVPGD